MASPWFVEIAGVRHTREILTAQPPQITVKVNERSTARIACKPGFVPNRFDDVLISYDGVNPVFRGLVMRRTLDPLAMERPPYRTVIDCIDYGATADWCYATLSYDVPVTLKQILTDLIATQLTTFGITLDPTQAVGDTLAPFVWTNKRVSDCLRELMDRTGWVCQFGPWRTLAAYPPGSRPASLSITDATPNCQGLAWSDMDTLPANEVILTCGTVVMPGFVTQDYDLVGDGVTTSWTLNMPGTNLLGPDGQPMPGQPSTMPYTADGGAGSLLVDGVVYHCFPGFEQFTWNEDHAILSVGTAPVPAAGQHLTFSRNFNLPFTVKASSGKTPRIVQLVSAPDIFSPVQGQEVVDGLLAQLDQPDLRQLTITAHDVRWVYAVGTVITINLASRITCQAMVTDLTITIAATQQGDPIWRVVMQAQEGPGTIQGSPLAGWRALMQSGNLNDASGGSAALTVVSPAPAAPIVPAPAFLGGTRTASQAPAPATWLPVLDWVPYRASSSFTARIRVDLWARNAGVSAQARLFNLTDNAPVDGCLTDVVTSQIAQSVVAVGTLEVGHTYRLEVLNGVSGEGVYAIGTLENA